MIIVGEGTWHNLWDIKAVFRGFELVSRLHVNFIKSKVIGLNIKQSFLEVTSSFLACGVRIIPFLFLGIPVGANPRMLSTHQPLLDNLRIYLSKWKGTFLSLGGRVTLLNYVLN